ncbi:trichohyalin [Lingula anatina]|uniref:Trichohyalin n=1 Tax=Lingula anatina TaxID=7574 RepID=A0A1S3JFC4_LINAN|nr:trichohyalin [Lingula anatina]|eukprot:XP_013409115.1 trichohyalin [Lingula anatina]
MGCGSSTGNGSSATLEGKEPYNNNVEKENNKQIQNGHIQNGQVCHEENHEEPVTKEMMNADQDQKDKPAAVRTSTPVPVSPGLIKNNDVKKSLRTPSHSAESNSNRHEVIVETHETPKAIAFDVALDEQNGLNQKPAPKRFQKLEPLSTAPKLTPELLEEKMKQVEIKREQELERVKTASRKSSKRRRELIQAREFERQQQQYNQMEEQQKSAGKNREVRQQEIIEKQKRREERARKARERALKLQQMNTEELDFDVEKDEAFNADDNDSWLDGDNNTRSDDLDERIYSGRTSPLKRVGPPKVYPHSASTTDSFDNAFMRSPPASSSHHDQDNRDDFFDS